MKDKKYIIVEVIPEALTPEKGNLVQLSALKIDGLQLIDRFDYRIKEEKITNPYVKELVSYDKESFKYVASTKKILKDFEKFTDNLDVLVLDNEYTNNFLRDIPNKKAIHELFDMKFTDSFIEEVTKKYNLEPSNYIVDLLYEALIYKSNN